MPQHFIAREIPGRFGVHSRNRRDSIPPVLLVPVSVLQRVLIFGDHR